MLPPTGPGKSSPKLLVDFLLFDPTRSSGAENVLAGNVLAEPIRDACKHQYTTKASQSLTPPLDLRPDGTTYYKLAVICRVCRIHADIVIDHSESTDCCPNSTNPLHHWLRDPALDEQSTTVLSYGWQCSSASCGASLAISYKLQRTQPYITTLTDTSLLKSRYEDIVRRDPEREGTRQATPVDSLSRLRKYIKDALNPEHTRRTFPSNNKRFIEAFGFDGQECRWMLEALGFYYAEAEGTWTLPLSGTGDTPEKVQKQREFLEDVEIELRCLIPKIAKDNNLINPVIEDAWIAANRDLERILAAQGYPRMPGTRRVTPEMEVCYAGLGALPDFSDFLIEWCYDRQSMCDPEQSPYYYECLRENAAHRASEPLSLKVVMLESQGCVTRSQLREAYLFFDLPEGGGGSDDVRILNLYQARQPDLSPEMAERSRQMLLRIGNSRGSKLLVNAAQQSIETVEEALTWLSNGVSHDTSDELLITVYTLRTENDPAKEEIGRKAIRVIAEARQSEQLKTWLDTGRTDGNVMSVDEALRHLDIADTIDSVDETLWPTIFDNARMSRPGTVTDKAITAIQAALAGVQPSHTTEDWPVGLTSLGNTCYLNSLLQYYFSIKPLRDIVLDYEKFKFDLVSASEKRDRVGQRQISAVEIKGGQRFAEDLKHLFERMITDPSSAVKPEQDLVCRAFLDPKDTELWDKKDKPEDDHAVDDTPVESKSTDEDAEHAEYVDIKMSDLPPTPPDSPGSKPQTTSIDPPPLPPRRFSTTTNAALERAQGAATQQQDVTEVHDGIQFRLRAGLKPKGHDASGEQLDDLLELFSIELLDTPVKAGQPLKPQILRDSAIQLNVPTEPTDIYSALDAVFDLQPVDSEGKIERYKSIVNMPPFLQVNIPRVGYDREKGEQFKSEHSIKLVDELYMDRYFADGSNTLLQRRQKAWTWRRKLADLKKERALLHTNSSTGLDKPTATAEVSKYIQQLETINTELQELGFSTIDYDARLPSLLNDTAQSQGAQLNQLDEDIKALESHLAGQFEDLSKIKYRLQAVFFHRGKSAHGHYWCCIRDFSSDTWRRYNDEHVDKVNPNKVNEIFEANEWAHGTPTYATYVRDDIKTEVTQPVCRHVERPSVMQEGSVDSSNTLMDTSNPPQDTAFVIEGGEQRWDKDQVVEDQSIRW